MRELRRAELIALTLPFAIGIPLVLAVQGLDHVIKGRSTAEIQKQCQDEASQSNTSTVDRIRIKTSCLCRYPEAKMSQDQCYLAGGMTPEKPYDPWPKNLSFANVRNQNDVSHLCQVEAEKQTIGVVEHRAIKEQKLEIECLCRHPLDAIDVHQCQVNRKTKRYLSISRCILME